MTASGHDPQLLSEALLYVEWAQGAAGRWMPAPEPGPSVDLRAPAASTPDARPVGSPAPRTGRRRPAGRAAPAPAPRITTPSVADRTPALSPEERVVRLDSLRSDVAECKRCKLCADRTQTVFGQGSTSPRLVIVGEAPGAEEDRTGEAFVGRAGQLLTKMLGAIGLAREDVFICNVLKCRPPQNRNPRPDEVGACRPYLHEQLEILRPEVVLALGSPAVRELLRTERGITRLRGRFARTPDGWRVMPTYHPAYLLRKPEAKREAWHDLKKVAAELGLEIPGRG